MPFFTFFKAIPITDYSTLWYDGTDIDGDGSENALYDDLDPVPTWADKGLLGEDASQATGSAQPTFLETGGPDGGPAIHFATSEDWLESSTFSSVLVQPNMLAFVAAPGDGSGGGPRHYFGGDSASGLNTVYVSAGLITMHAGVDLNGIAPVIDQWGILVGKFDSTSSFMRINGNQEAAGDTGTQGLGRVRINASSGGTPTGELTFAEILFYNEPVAAVEIENYFSNHYNVAFPVTP